MEESARKRVVLLMQGPAWASSSAREGVISEVVVRTLAAAPSAKRVVIPRELSEALIKQHEHATFGLSQVPQSSASSDVSGARVHRTTLLGWLRSDGRGLYFEDAVGSNLAFTAVAGSLSPECINSLVLVRRAAFIRKDGKAALRQAGPGEGIQADGSTVAQQQSPTALFMVDLHNAVPVFTIQHALRLLPSADGASGQTRPGSAAAGGGQSTVTRKAGQAPTVSLLGQVTAVLLDVTFDGQPAAIVHVWDDRSISSDSRATAPILLHGPSLLQQVAQVRPGGRYAFTRLSPKVLFTNLDGQTLSAAAPDYPYKAIAVLQCSQPSVPSGRWWGGQVLADDGASWVASESFSNDLRPSNELMPVPVLFQRLSSFASRAGASVLEPSLRAVGVTLTGRVREAGPCWVRIATGGDDLVTVLLPASTTPGRCILPRAARLGCVLTVTALHRATTNGTTRSATPARLYVATEHTVAHVDDLAPMPSPSTRDLVRAVPNKGLGLGQGLARATDRALLLHRLTQLYLVSTLLRHFSRIINEVGATLRVTVGQPKSLPWADQYLEAVGCGRGAAVAGRGLARGTDEDESDQDEDLDGVRPGSFGYHPARVVTPSHLCSLALAAGHAVRRAASACLDRPAVPWSKRLANDPRARHAAQREVDSHVAAAVQRACGLVSGASSTATSSSLSAPSTISAHVCESWSQVRIPLAALSDGQASACRLLGQYGHDPPTGLATLGDDHCRLPLLGFAPVGAVRSDMDGSRGTHAPVEVLGCEGWSLIVDVIAAPVLFGMHESVLTPAQGGGKAGGTGGRGLSPTVDQGSAQCTAQSVQPPRIASYDGSVVACAHRLLSADTLTDLSAAGAESSGTAATACSSAGAGAGASGGATVQPVVDPSSVWRGGWAGGWVDLWWDRHCPRAMPASCSSAAVVDGRLFAPSVQWRVRTYLVWEGGADRAGKGRQGYAQPHSIATLGGGTPTTALNPVPALHSRALWLCPSLPPAVTVARWPAYKGAEYLPAPSRAGAGSSSSSSPATPPACALLVSVEGVAMPARDAIQGVTPPLIPTPGGTGDRPPSAMLCEVANCVNLSADSTSIRFHSPCSPVLPLGLASLRPGEVVLVRYSGHVGLDRGRVPADGKVMQLDRTVRPSRSQQCWPLMSMARASCRYGEGSAAVDGRLVKIPTTPRLLFTVRGALSAVAECASQLRRNQAGDEEGEEQVALWREAVLADPLQGAKGAAVVASGWGPSGHNLKHKPQAQEQHKPVYNKPTKAPGGGSSGVDGRPPFLSILGRVEAITLEADPEYGHGSDQDEQEGTGQGNDPAHDLFSRWVAVGPCGLSLVKLHMVLSHVQARGDDAAEDTHARQGEHRYDTIDVFVCIQGSGDGMVLGQGFGPGAVVLVTECSRDYGGGHRVYMRSAPGKVGQVHVLAAPWEGPQAIHDAVSCVAGVYALVDDRPMVRSAQGKATAPLPLLRQLHRTVPVNRNALVLQATVSRIVTVTIGWICPTTGGALQPLPPVLSHSPTPGHTPLWLSLLPAGAGVYRTACAPGRTLFRREHIDTMMEGYIRRERAAASGKASSDGRPGRSATPHSSRCLLRLDARVLITDGTGQATVECTDMYTSDEVNGVAIVAGHGAQARPYASLTGTTARLLGMTARQLGHWAACAAAFGPLQVDTRFGADMSVLAPGASAGPAYPTVEAAAAAGVMLGTWLPAGAGSSTGTAQGQALSYDPIKDTEKADKQYWGALMTAMAAARTAARAVLENTGDDSGGASGAGHEAMLPRAGHKRALESPKITLSSLRRQVLAALQSSHGKAISTARADPASELRQFAHMAAREAMAGHRPASSRGTLVGPVPLHMRVPYRHAALASTVLRQQVLGRLGGAQHVPGQSTAPWTLVLRPFFKADFLPFVMEITGDTGAGKAAIEDDEDEEQSGPSSSRSRARPRLSREMRWRRDVALRQGAPLLQALIKRNMQEAREVAMAHAVTTWHEATVSSAARAPGPATTNRLVGWSAAVSHALAAGGLGMPCLPGSTAGTRGDIRVLLPHPPTCSEAVPPCDMLGRDDGEATGAATRPGDVASTLRLIPLRFRLLDAWKE